MREKPLCLSRFNTTAGVLDHPKSMVAPTTPGGWNLARNFEPSLQTDPDALTFAEPDEVSRGIPVFVLNASGSTARHSWTGSRLVSVEQ